MMEAYMPFLIWGGLFILTVVAEIATQQLISIWFAAGSLAAFLAVCFDGSPVLQIVLFFVVSILLLLLTRPIVRKVFSFRIENTNLQEVGRVATVIQPIDPLKNTGRVRLDGVDWIAVSQNEEPIPNQTSVRIEAIEGTKLFVTVLPETVVSTK